MNRYYVAARHISEAIGRGQDSPNTHASLHELVEKVKRDVQLGNSDCVAIVEIVAVVRVEKKPVTIEYLGNPND